MDKPVHVLVQGDEVVALIPQKAPIVMVDTLYECGDGRAVTGITIREDNMFCDGCHFREAGIIEHIAQSAALKAGYEQMIKNAPPVTGYIGSIKNFTLHCMPSVGNRLVTVIEILHIVGDITVLRGTTTCNDRLVAECEMKVLEPRA